MTDGHGETPKNSDGESFDWLYGTQAHGVGAGQQPAQATPAREDGVEATRVIPRASPTSPSPASPPPAKKPRPSVGAPPFWKRPRTYVRLVIVLVVLWVAYLVAVPIFAWNDVSKVAAEPAGARPADQPGTTYLLVGSDSRRGLTPEQRKKFHTGGDVGKRTDTIMVLHTGSGPNLLMSIPRDSLVPVPGHGTTKINAAYAYGGPRLLVKTIEADTGIRIDDYVEIGFAGFVNVVDAVGGIQICPKTAMDDKDANLHIKKGCQHADGTTALAWARSRHAQKLGDIDRAAHQREVVSKVGSEALSPSTFLNPFRYWDLAFSGAESVRVGKNVSAKDFANFAMAMRSVSAKSGLTCGVPISDFAVHWDTERAPQLFKLIQQDRTSDIPKRLCRQSGLRS